MLNRAGFAGGHFVWVFCFVVQHHSNGALTDFGREFVRCLAHIGSNLSEASGKSIGSLNLDELAWAFILQREA
ncbi:hypothetical protein NOI87_32635, partial [Neorhizobium galegae]|uniref:hypothetical protein n=1 Tax=Neorhizobium galegae TaxID=399 RepID=UPI0021041A48